MNALQQIEAPRAVHFSLKSFEAFRVTDRHTTPLGMIDAATVDEALNEALTRQHVDHKEHLAIRETGESGSRLHLFAIKRKSSPAYVWDARQQRTVAQHRLYAAPVCVMDERVLAGAEWNVVTGYSLASGSAS